jgi:hypothetical protein
VGTQQSAISRLEADEVSPSVETLELLMRAMGEGVDLTPVLPERRYDPLHRRATAARTPAERLALGISWNRMAGRLRARRVTLPVTAPDVPLDAERILKTLAEHRVDYVLIGGLAVQTHGHVRTTNDADLIPAPEPANLERLAGALRALDAKVLNPGEEETPIDAKMLPRQTTWQFATRDGGIDVMHEVPGGRPFSELSKRTLHVRLGEIDVPVVDLDDLIRMKLARGRSVDLEDVAALTDPDVS